MSAATQQKPQPPALPEPGACCTECKRPSPVLVTMEPGIGPLGNEPCHLCPKCWRKPL